jgi:hypothetical protein
MLLRLRRRQRPPVRAAKAAVEKVAVARKERAKAKAAKGVPLL